MFRTLAALTLASLLSTHSVCRAVIVTSLETDVAPAGTEGDPYNPTFVAGGPSSSDLLQGILPSSVTGSLTYESSLGAPALTNGTVETAYGSGNAAAVHTAYAAAGGGESVTYALGSIYDISSLVIFGGWNDAGRDSQIYDIYYSDDGAENFTLLTSYSNDPGEEYLVVTTPVSHRVEFTDDTETYLATGVTHLLIDFKDGEFGYLGYTEIDVYGDLQNIPGDADGDGDVDIDDFYVISDNFFTTPSVIGADGDVLADNFVDEQDFRLWKSVASASVLAEFAALSAPEPSSLVLACLSLGLATRRRQK